MLRTPQFHLGAELCESWEALKISISHSSPEFYQRIKACPAEQLSTLPDAVLQTVHKYFNRARYRSTPFGSFAGISLLDLTAQNGENSINVDQNLVLHHYQDWAAQNSSIEASLDELKASTLLIANSSHYPCGQVLRYLSRTEERFQLCELANTSIIRDILEDCKTAISYAELIDRLRSPSVKKRQLISLIKEMIAARLLLKACGPGIIGDHPKAAGNGGKNTYIIAERKIHSGKLNAKAFTHLPALIDIMSRIKLQQDPPALTEFIQNFQVKFGTDQVPLLQALDPDQGIGYAGLEHSLDQSELVDLLCKQNQQSKETEQRLKETLFSPLKIATTGQGNPLRLEDIPLGETGAAPPTLPNSLSALVSVLGDQVYLCSVGGCTANALLGRFSIASPQIEACCRQIAGLEQRANPEVIFFDLSYTAEKSTGNINRRAAIYPHQINILNPGSSAESIPLNELLVCVRDGELILSTAALNKRLVPRMASAYNYVRSELPIFRLLCDLQHQGIQSSPVPDLEQLIPGFKHYPRFVYKNIIISPEKWKIELSSFQPIATETDPLASLKRQLQELGTTRCTKFGQADQTLSIDRENQADLWLLYRHLKRVEVCYLEEDFSRQSTLVKDQFSRPYHHELLLLYTHNQQIYRGYSPQKPKVMTTANPQIYTPGQPWLYFELYCGPAAADIILSGLIPALLKVHQKEISKWFFVRYSENGHHIRLRLKLRELGITHTILQAVYHLLDAQLQAGLISELLVKPYRPELQRYGAEQIGLVESHFHIGSKLVHILFSSQLTDQQKYLLNQDTLAQIRASGLFEPQVFCGLIDQLSDSYLREHGVTGSGFKMLNHAYKTFLESTAKPLNVKTTRAHQRFSQSMLSTLASYHPAERGKILGDLLHMHFNRLFAQQQRSHEMIFYYFQSKRQKRNQSGMVTTPVKPPG
jgi:thiopeptide-type bacteriocin biosynthesis protein